ncbi:helix-turn-helix transcriptional regulator [Achromobacter insuavis]
MSYSARNYENRQTENIAMASEDEDIGARIHGVRKAAGLNQQGFAARLGTSSGHISELETGKSVPGGKFLLSLKREFRIDIDWLLTGEGERPAALLSEDERILVEQFRHTSKAGRDALLQTGAVLAEGSKIKRRKAA